MRVIYVFLFVLGFSLHAICQSPERLSYQAVIRDASGNLVANQSVGMRITIVKGSATGTAVYIETQKRSTNASGLVILEIGGGSPVSGNMASVNWGQGPFFIKTETDLAGGTNYQLIGTSQLLSVPYSLYAQSAALKYSNSGDTLFSGKEFVIIPGLSMANSNAVANGSPTVTTTAASSVTSVSAEIGGDVISIGASNVTSRGICYATTASPTVSNNTVASGSGIGSFNVTIPGLNPATTYYVRSYATNSSGTSYGNQVIFSTLGSAAQACALGSTLTVTHTVGDVAPVTKTVTYKLVQTDLSGASKCWIAQNLGADRQPSALNDNTESSAGWYWQFNRKRGYYHDGQFLRVPQTDLQSINENSNWVEGNDPCKILLGSNWRLPLSIEWENVAVNMNGNATNLFNSVLRVHRAGYISGIPLGGISSRGLIGLYHSANQYQLDRSYRLYQQVTRDEIGIDPFGQKEFALTLRCIKD